MKKISLIPLLILVIPLIASEVCFAGGAIMNQVPEKIQSHKIYLVKKVSEDNLIELSDGRQLHLLGVEVKNNKRLYEFLNQAVAGKRVIVETDQLIGDDSYCYIYLWGIDPDSLQQFLNKSAFEYRGFLDAGEGLWGKRKGLALFLNATIIKSGLAKTDRNQQFSLREKFLKWEDLGRAQ